MNVQAGTVLEERYRLLERIGAGGYGDVWRARDQQHDLDVAVKLVDVSAASVAETHTKVERVRREAVMLSKLRHPNVVSILDVGVAEQWQLLMLVTEFLDGHTVEDELEAHGAIDPERAIARVLEALDGLQAAHAASIIHKDLKPANLFLQHSEHGERLKLIDFGIGRLNTMTKLTTTGRMTGSPRYMAPEYILGNDVTFAVDIYQIGLTLAEMLTGEPCIPRGLPLLEVCERHVVGNLTISEELRATPIGAVIERATAREPAKRFASTLELAAALRSLQLRPFSKLDFAKTTAVVSPFLRDHLPGEITVEELVTLRALDATAQAPAPLEVAERPRFPMPPPKWIAAGVAVGVVFITAVALFFIVAMGLTGRAAREQAVGQCLLQCSQTHAIPSELQACENSCRTQ